MFEKSQKSRSKPNGDAGEGWAFVVMSVLCSSESWMFSNMERGKEKVLGMKVMTTGMQKCSVLLKEKEDHSNMIKEIVKFISDKKNIFWHLRVLAYCMFIN